MRAFVTYLTEQSPSPQLNTFGHGWIELPGGKRWHPSREQSALLKGLHTGAKQSLVGRVKAFLGAI